MYIMSLKKLSCTLFLLASIVSSSAFASLFGNDEPDSKVLGLAIKAYNTAAKQGLIDNAGILTIIDYSLPSTSNRLFVIDLDHNNKVLFSTLVAHGKGSGENFATHFSNSARTLTSSLGVFLTENTYSGKHGYSLKIKGLENGFNDRAESRTIVIHPAEYVSKGTIRTLGRLGRSWGCPALEPEVSKPIIDTIKNGSLIFAYANDRTWLNKSRFLHS